MNVVTVHPPEIGANKACFRWTVEPSSRLYQMSAFTLRFPSEVNLAAIPDALWLTAVIACLHAQWPLLRPCRVFLPATLPDGEVEVWQRLLDAEIATLEVMRGTGDFERTIEIVGRGPRLQAPSPRPDATRGAAAFSGGRDSLVQAGLLAELTERPLLVATTSPLPPLNDHATPRRREVLDGIVRRRSFDLVEVFSDFRASWDNRFADRNGYAVAVNELTDVHLYFAALLLVGYALGARHLFVASEADVQENVDIGGRTVQHTHLMYSAVTQRALSALLLPSGLSYGSLTWPLPGGRVQELLVRRYADLADLQYSCWKVGPSEAACNGCSKCLKAALEILAAGGDPRRAGFDVARLLFSMRDFRPRSRSLSARPVLPGEIVARDHHLAVVRTARALRLRRIAAAVAGSPPRDALRAFSSLLRIRRRSSVERPGPEAGWRPGFLRWIDPEWRGRLERIFGEAFPAAEESSYAPVLARSEALTKWIVEPLGHAA